MSEQFCLLKDVDRFRRDSQCWPSSTNAARNMLKISNKQAVCEFVNALQPDALAMWVNDVRDDRKIVYPKVNFVVDNFRKTLRLSCSQVDVLYRTVCWIMLLNCMSDRVSRLEWERSGHLRM